MFWAGSAGDIWSRRAGNSLERRLPAALWGDERETETDPFCQWMSQQSYPSLHFQSLTLALLSSLISSATSLSTPYSLSPPLFPSSSFLHLLTVYTSFTDSRICAGSGCTTWANVRKVGLMWLQMWDVQNQPHKHKWGQWWYDAVRMRMREAQDQCVSSRGRNMLHTCDLIEYLDC